MTSRRGELSQPYGRWLDPVRKILVYRKLDLDSEGADGYAASMATTVNRPPRGYLPHLRAERLVAGGRVVLAFFSLLAVWLDPQEPVKAAPFGYALLSLYLVYAGVLAAVVLRLDAPPRRWRLVDHSVDLVFFSLFMYFTSGPASPFFAYFVFSLVGATLRWQWQGTLWTAVATLGAYLAVGFTFALVLDDPTFELDRFIIRSVYLLVVAVLLGYLGWHEARTRRDIENLADQPNALAYDPAVVETELVEWAQRVLGGSRLVLVWSDSEEPGVRIAAVGALLTPGPPSRVPNLGDWAPTQPLTRLAVADAGATSAWRVARQRGDLLREPGLALAAEARAWIGGGAILNLPLVGEAVEGRLVVADPPGPAADLLALGEVVAAAIAARLDHLHLARRLRENAAASERIALARDLHDGVLQSLTGVALRLATLQRLCDTDPAAVRGGVGALQRLIALEQRELRFFVDELKPLPPGSEAGDGPIRFVELTTAFERIWDVDVVLEGADLEGVPESQARHLRLLAREALVNAARHAEPATITVTIGRSEDGTVRLEVRDDGGGFGFDGTRDALELRASGGGPRSLIERTLALGGSLVVVSAPTGSTVRIDLPAAGAREYA